MNTYEVIEAAANLIEVTGWSQGCNARAADGEQAMLHPYPNDPRPPVSFCAHGALCKVSAGEPTRSYAYDSVSDLAFDALNRSSPNLSIVSFNDAPGRTKEEVLTLMRGVAIKLRTIEMVSDDALHAALFN